MDFDNYLKAMAGGEATPVSQRYKDKLENVLGNLDTGKPSTYRIKRRIPLVAVIILIGMLACGTVLAVNYVLSMRGSRIGFFEGTGDQVFSEQQGYWEKTSDQVDMIVMDGGPLEVNAAVTGTDPDGRQSDIQLTIDNIGMDMNYLNIYYTIRTERPIKAVLQENWGTTDGAMDEMYDPDTIHYSIDGWSFNIMVDGEPFDAIMPEGRAAHGYLKDDSTYVGTLSYSLLDTIPETFTLSLEAKQLLDEAGSWKAAFDVDLTKVYESAQVAYPNQPVDIVKANGDQKTVVIERVSLTENGGMIVIQDPDPSVAQEVLESPMDGYDYIGLLIKDRNGTVLNSSVNASVDTSGILHPRKILEFSSDGPLTEITLVPYAIAEDRVSRVTLMFDEAGTPVEAMQGGTVTLLEHTIDESIVRPALSVVITVVLFVGASFPELKKNFDFGLVKAYNEMPLDANKVYESYTTIIDEVTRV